MSVYSLPPVQILNTFVKMTRKNVVTRQLTRRANIYSFDVSPLILGFANQLPDCNYGIQLEQKI